MRGVIKEKTEIKMFIKTENLKYRNILNESQKLYDPSITILTNGHY